LNDGDSVIVIKDLKIQGSSSSVKNGTKVRKIKLADMGDGHNIACKIDGIVSINLKSEFVRKA
jgi:protein PhnA